MPAPPIHKTTSNMAKEIEEQKQMTMEEYLLSQLDEPALLKGGGVMTRADGTPMTKNEVKTYYDRNRDTREGTGMTAGLSLRYLV